MKKVFIAAMAIALFLGTTNVYGADYTDVWSSNWAFFAIREMSDKGIISGYPDETFKPNNKVAYGEFIKMAVISITGEDLGNTESGHWAENYYNKAIKLGYFTTDDISKSVLGEDIPRAHMALIISSILGDVTIENYNEIQGWLKDITSKTAYEYDITKSYATGVLTGYTDGTFKPDGTLTRAEAAMAIYRLTHKEVRVEPSDLSPVRDAVANFDSHYTNNGSFDLKLAKTKSVSYAPVSVIAGFTLNENRGTKWIKSTAEFEKTYYAWMYLIKDGKVIESLANGIVPVGTPNVYLYTQDITKVDYIGLLDVEDYNLILVPNPFKSK
ncbi:S-layer homology domain-containing protein [Anoxybacterium hadale]|uniref:S-layer homology domain-containing protein n=1 Tax=Anoxybacterium hadale TaxID=3408580 RepID=A0ACD1ADL2_9FIRM|nr:S-layer homology domain-containing protein [Clostridiales bacterium]